MADVQGHVDIVSAGPDSIVVRNAAGRDTTIPTRIAPTRFREAATAQGFTLERKFGGRRGKQIEQPSVTVPDPALATAPREEITPAAGAPGGPQALVPPSGAAQVDLGALGGQQQGSVGQQRVDAARARALEALQGVGRGPRRVATVQGPRSVQRAIVTPELEAARTAQQDLLDADIDQAEAGAVRQSIALNEEAGLRQQEAETLIDAQQQAQVRETQKQQDIKDRFSNYEAARDDFLNTTIDPNGFWNRKDTGQKIGTAIGLLLGGFGSVLRGQGGNPALDMMNRAIDRDVQAQMENKRAKLLGVKEADRMLTVVQGLYSDEASQANVLKHSGLEAAAKQVEANIAKATNPTAIELMNAAVTDIRRQQSQLQLEQAERDRGTEAFKERKVVVGGGSRADAARLAKEAALESERQFGPFDPVKDSPKVVKIGNQIRLATSKEEARTLNDAIVEGDKLQSAMREVITIMEKGGTADPRQRRLAEGALSRVTTAYNVQFAKLGVLAGPDKELIDAAVSAADNPAAFMNLGLPNIKATLSAIERSSNDLTNQVTRPVDQNKIPAQFKREVAASAARNAGSLVQGLGQ